MFLFLSFISMSTRQFKLLEACEVCCRPTVLLSHVILSDSSGAGGGRLVGERCRDDLKEALLSSGSFMHSLNHVIYQS